MGNNTKEKLTERVGLSEPEIEALQNVTGGCKGDWRTVMECSDRSFCCYKTEWLGDYRGKGPFKCNNCHCMTLWGTDKYYQG